MKCQPNNLANPYHLGFYAAIDWCAADDDTCPPNPPYGRTNPKREQWVMGFQDGQSEMAKEKGLKS